MGCGWEAAGLFPNIERDALKALKTAGGWAHVRRRCPSRDQGEFWRVDPTPTMQGALWTVRRQAGLPPGAMSQSWLTELLGWGGGGARAHCLGSLRMPDSWPEPGRTGLGALGLAWCLRRLGIRTATYRNGHGYDTRSSTLNGDPIPMVGNRCVCPLCRTLRVRSGG